jgi:hypothetical protein
MAGQEIEEKRDGPPQSGGEVHVDAQRDGP